MFFFFFLNLLIHVSTTVAGSFRVIFNYSGSDLHLPLSYIVKERCVYNFQLYSYATVIGKQCCYC